MAHNMILSDSCIPYSCFCIGPQNGDSLCPCVMRAKQTEEDNLRLEIMKKYHLVPKKEADLG